MPSTNNQSQEQTAEKELSTPHFDERAVATAHPVEPLSTRNLSSWRGRPLLIAVAAVAFVSVAAVTAFWAAGSNGSALVDKPNEGVQAAPSPKPPESPGLKVREEAPQVAHASPKPGLGKRTSETTRTVVAEEQAKPVARKVGVITYSHSGSRVQP